MKVETAKLPDNVPVLKKMFCIKNGEIIIREVSHFVFGCSKDEGVNMLARGINPPMQAIPMLLPDEFIVYDKIGKTHLITSTREAVLDVIDKAADKEGS